MRIKKVVGWTLSSSFLVAGVALMAVFAVGFFDLGVSGAATDDRGPDSANAPATVEQSAGGPDSANVPTIGQPVARQSGGPEDKTLTVTIPGMSRIEDDRVPNTVGTDEQALKENAAIHLQGTGFPWQEESNTYLAGHRLGYPATESFLAFWDLNKLEKGDKVFVEDSEGTEYTYEVYETFVTGPSDLSVTEPVEGKNVLTLQSCTLPNYTDRLIVRGELVEKEAA